MNKVMLNTAVFLTEMNDGQSQINLLKNLTQPIDGFEVRGEFFKDDKADELQQLMTLAQEKSYDFYYSIPETLFTNGELNEHLAEHFRIASEYKIDSLKISLGVVNLPTPEQVTVLNNLIEVTGVNLTIENEPNPNGTIEHLVDVCRTLTELGFLGGYTFDAGNWYWINEDPIAAMNALAKYTTVLHLKNIHNQETTLLDTGDTDWHVLCDKVTDSTPIILEYQINPADLADELNKLKQYLKVS